MQTPFTKYQKSLPMKYFHLAGEFREINDACFEWAETMSKKLTDKACEGYSGWNDYEDEETLEIMTDGLCEHFEKAKGRGFSWADLVDISNFCMMLARAKERVPVTEVLADLEEACLR